MRRRHPKLSPTPDHRSQGSEVRGQAFIFDSYPLPREARLPSTAVELEQLRVREGLGLHS